MISSKLLSKVGWPPFDEAWTEHDADAYVMARFEYYVWNTPMAVLVDEGFGSDRAGNSPRRGPG